MTSDNLRPNLNGWLLPLFFIICYAVAAFGAQFTPGEWYAQLNRAPWNPPNAAFPIVWTILYAMIAVAGWLIFASQSTFAKGLWVAQLIANGVWSWLFFAQHWVLVSLLDITLLALLLCVLIAHCWKAGLRTAAWLLMPYLVWIILATSLNAYIQFNN